MTISDLRIRSKLALVLSLLVVPIMLLAWLFWRMRLRRIRAQFSLAFAERARLSREIHDTLLQGMVGVSLQFDALSTKVEWSAETRRTLIRARHELQEYIREAREAISELRSPVLQQRSSR